MVNNKQVNLWRGDMTPPTIYHIWIKDNSKLLLYDGKKWVVFLDNKDVTDTINEILEQIEGLQTDIKNLGNKTVNNKPIKDNPVLNGNDLLIGQSGNYINASDKVSESTIKLDSLLTTQIIE